MRRSSSVCYCSTCGRELFYPVVISAVRFSVYVGLKCALPLDASLILLRAYAITADFNCLISFPPPVPYLVVPKCFARLSFVLPSCVFGSWSIVSFFLFYRFCIFDCYPELESVSPAESWPVSGAVLKTKVSTGVYFPSAHLFTSYFLPRSKGDAIPCS